jgi:alpha-1,3-mannosyltransferase
VYIYRLLYALTDGGKNIPLAQQLYGALYILSLIITCAIYKRANAPNWIIVLLPLSKRLHSIYSLRLFNDCWAVVIAQAAVFTYAQGWDDLATLLYT